MTPKTMIRLCGAALQKLEDLEPLAVYLPSEARVNQFVYESIQAVRELKHVARLESAHSVTSAQVRHIHRIISKTNYFLSLVPGSVRNELDE